MIKLPRPIRRAWKSSSKRVRESIVNGTPDWLREHVAPTGAFLDMLVIDHGLFRYMYMNKHPLAKDAWRSAQPAPWHIRRLAQQGIRTIINLRGERLCGSYYLEREACAQQGIKLVNFQIRSRAAPTREELRAARAILDQAEYPILLHCKSGADRAGLMSVLFRHWKNGEPIELARRELSMKFGHFRQADTGVLDYFFERYLEDSAKRPMPFLEWVETVYDAEDVQRSFRSKGWANRLVNGVLKRE